MSYSSVITIEELSAAGGSTLQVVTLVGPGLPFMGAEWGGENNVVTTWYPGNADEGTQQNLGPKEVPSSWQGDWRRTMMGSCPSQYQDSTGNVSQVVDPSALRDALETIFRAGRRLRVTWTTTQEADGTTPQAYPITGSIVREGRAKTWKFKHRTIHDIEWDITFDWASRGATTPRVTSTRAPAMSAAGSAYLAALQMLQSAANQPFLQLSFCAAITLGNFDATSPIAVDQASATVDLLAGLQDDYDSLTTINASLPDQPVQVVQAAVAHAADAVDQSDAIYQQYSAVPAELLSANTDAVSVLRALALFAPIPDAALQAEIQAWSFCQKMRDSLPQHAGALSGRNRAASGPDPRTVITIYTVRDGDTPQSISARFYQTPDHAADIMRANGLSWHTTSLPTGRQLVIPVISAAQTV
jgi:hypothetical protein